jgi:hypothetical protein
MFNHEYELIFDAVPIKDVKPLDTTSYKAGGMTALLDAVGRTIDGVLDRIGKTPIKEQPDRVIVGIITDGFENSSTEYTKSQIEERVKDRQENNWEFHFMGAHPASFAEAQGIGIVSDNITGWQATPIGTQAAYVGYSNTVASSRGGDHEMVGGGSGSDDTN